MGRNNSASKGKAQQPIPRLACLSNLANSGQVCQHLTVPVLPRPTNKGKPRFLKTWSTQLSKAGSPCPEVTLAVDSQVYSAVHLLGILSCSPTSKTCLPMYVCTYVRMYVCMYVYTYSTDNQHDYKVGKKFQLKVHQIV